MIEGYLRQIDELLSASPIVSAVEIIRHSVRDTELEKVLNYRYRATLTDGGMIELSERIVEMQGGMIVTRYRHHWQDGSGRLIKRWDNAPHYPEIDTFPHHLHQGDRVVSHPAINGLEALQRILAEFETSISARRG
jgi:hypothetical protein